MGSGRVGSTIAERLDSQGHSVAIIDQDSSAFRRLPSNFSGQRIKGVGFDQDTLNRSNIQDAYAFAAVSSDDNSNILAARIARDYFGVEHVVARIYDSQKADVYERMGIPTTGTVNWSATAILKHLLPGDSEIAYSETEADMNLVKITPSDAWIGHPIREISESIEGRIGYLLRAGRADIDLTDAVLQENDIIVLLASSSSINTAKKLLLQKPRED